MIFCLFYGMALQQEVGDTIAEIRKLDDTNNTITESDRLDIFLCTTVKITTH